MKNQVIEWRYFTARMVMQGRSMKRMRAEEDSLLAFLRFNLACKKLSKAIEGVAKKDAEKILSAFNKNPTR